MKKILCEISNFITDPEWESDVGLKSAAFCLVGIVCWLIMGLVLIKGIPVYLPIICVSAGIVCNIIWYFIDVSNEVLNKVLHYFYAILCIFFYGVFLFVIPMALIFIIFAAPVWICKLICEIRERGAYEHKKF